MVTANLKTPAQGIKVGKGLRNVTLVVLLMTGGCSSFCDHRCAVTRHSRLEPTIRDIEILATFHLRLRDTLTDRRLHIKYSGILGIDAYAGLCPYDAQYGMFQWEISAVGATEDDGTPNEAVATLMIEHGEQACALAVCEIDGVLFSVYLDATWDADLVDSKLKRLGIPPLRIILQPLDKRRHGKLSRGGTDIVTMHAGEPGEPGQPLE